MSIPNILEVVDALERCLDRGQNPVALHEPLFEGNEWKYVKDCLDSGWVSYLGSYVNDFEQALSDFTGAADAIVTSSGTAALHVALHAVGVEPNDEVLMPALTFVATANAVSYCGALPHFVDNELDSLAIDPCRLDEYLRANAEIRNGGCWNIHTGRRIRAILPVHIFGLVGDIVGLVELAEEWGLVLVEDAAESLGSYWRQQHTGTFGTVGTLSFNGNKTITTGGGGAILTNDKALGKRIRHLCTTARVPSDMPFGFSHDEIGFNVRLPNVNAAIGLAQMEQLASHLERKRTLATRYAEAFSSVSGVRFLTEMTGTTSNYWLNAIMLDEDAAYLRDDLLRYTNDRGLSTRPTWSLMPNLPMYDEHPSMDLPNAREVEKRLLNLPSGPGLVRGR